jgi:hypothetical protein
VTGLSSNPSTTHTHKKKKKKKKPQNQNTNNNKTHLEKELFYLCKENQVLQLCGPPIFIALRKRQENCEFQAKQGYIVMSSLKRKEKATTKK